jgi:NAD(P)-dependent dehydrogenase (short-subunit alcohol dehydrogenase family)
MANVALIVGAGPQLGAALGRRFAAEGLVPVLSARNAARLEAMAAAIPGAVAYPCDATQESAVDAMVAAVEARHGAMELAVYNPGGGFLRLPVVEQSAARMREVWEFTALGGFLVGRAVARRMLARGRGCILFTGATASLRGGPGFAAFAAGKFALRALAQSMARELHPLGIHVAHVVIDGRIATGGEAGTYLDPDDIAEAYAGLYRQKSSAWTQELDIRPMKEKF